MSDGAVANEDRARVRQAEAAANRAILKRLADLMWAPNHPHRRLVRSLLASDLAKINDWERHEIGKLAWMYRRDLPEHLGPKLNPDDPVVKELAHLDYVYAQESADLAVKGR